MSTEPALPPDDPYAVRPTFAQTHAALIWAAAVFALTATLTVICFPPFNVPEFAYAFAAPAIFWAYYRPDFRLFAWTLFAAQAVAWTILLWWLHHVTWVGLFLLGPFVGAQVGVWYLAVWWTMPRLKGRDAALRLAAMLGLAGLWVLLEWARTWFLGGFPWLPLAASQWQRTSLLQISAWTGAYGVSFVLIFFNLGFAAYAHRLFVEARQGLSGLRKRSPEFMAALMLLVFAGILPMTPAFNRAQFVRPLARVALVQPDIPQTVKWDPASAPHILEVLEKTTLAAAATQPDLILWPEATTPWAVRGDPNTRDWIESLDRRARTPMLFGSIAIEHPGRPDEAWYNGAFTVDPDTGLAPVYYAKRKLVPFGEYVPLRPLLGWLDKFVPIGGDFQRGDSARPLRVQIAGRQVAFGLLICYEDIFPNLARDDALAGADALVVLTNDAWFGDEGAAAQQAASSVLRAVETRRPVIRCGNDGWSGWIDEFGHIRGVMTDANGSIHFRGFQPYTVTRDARWIGRTTFYTEHGDWFVNFCLLLVAFGAAAVTIGKPAPKPRA